MTSNLKPENYVKTLGGQKRQFAFEAKNMQQIKEWQEKFRPELIKTLGIHNIEKRGKAPLDPEHVATEKLEDHTREEWRITSEPGYKIPFYVLKPLNATEKSPLAITLHGHGIKGKKTYAGIYETQEEYENMINGERDIALQAVRRGYIAIAPDQRAFGPTRFEKDIKEEKNNSCRTIQMHALLFGRTLTGERVWDVSRLIDYARTRQDINTSKIVVTGNSGGGTISLFAAAVDKRISVAIPGSYFCTFADSIGSLYHCECNYVPGIMNLGEMYDVAALIIPRPFLAVTGAKDHIFPVEAVKKSFTKVKKAYEIAGIPDKCELYIGDGGHRYYKERVWDFAEEWI